jgi:hypothetical protein
MDIITLNIYNDAAKQEILSFLRKFKPQEAEIKLETAKAPASKIKTHPFFGMIKESRETVEETMSRLRGSRY